MRVLQVIGAMDRGGAETMIMNLYRALDRSRIQFDFLVHEERACDYDEEIQDLGGKLFRVPRFTGANLLQYRQLCREVFENHPEHPLVHGHIGSSAALYLGEAKRAGKATVAHSHAQNFPLSLPQLGFRAVSYRTRFIADRFLACSVEAGRDRFGERVVQSEAFQVVKNAINVADYACSNEDHERAKAALGWEGVPVIGHVGRLHPVKNHSFLIEVFKQIHAETPTAKLVLVGRGPDEESVRAQVKAAGVGDCVVFYGLTDRVAEVLKAFDVFVFPSLSEGVPLAAIEAQASGIPCLVSTGVSELVTAVPQLVERLSLDEGSKVWADEAMRLVKTPGDRMQGADGVRVAGYDSAETARWLETYYEDVVSTFASVNRTV